MASEKVLKLVEEVKNLTVLELSELLRLWKRSSAFPPPRLLPSPPRPPPLRPPRPPPRKRPSSTLCWWKPAPAR